VRGAGGSLHAGYVVINDRNHLMYPYVGAAFNSHELLLANGHYPSSIAGLALTPGQREVLIGGGTAVDVGFTMFRLFWGDEGGMALGSSMGAWIPVSADEWSTDSGAVTTLEGTTGGFYFRVHVGGGGATRG